MTLLCFAQSLGGCSLTSLSCWGILPRFTQSLGDAPSLHSVTGGMLTRFAQLLGDAPSLHSVTGGCSLTLLSHWGDALWLHSVAGGMLPHFAQSLSIQWFHQIANLVVSYIRFNAYDNGMGTSLIASMAAHRSIYRYVASLLALKFRSSHHEQNTLLIALSSSFFLLAQERTTFAHLLGGLCRRACSPVVELGIPIPSSQC